MPVPAKNPPGRPKRNRILAESAFWMRREGVPLRKIQSVLNAQGVQLDDRGPEEKPYYRGACRWAASGEATLKQFKESEGRELEDLATLRALEAADLLMKIAAGLVPLVDADGRVIPQKRESEEAAARRASSYTLTTSTRSKPSSGSNVIPRKR